ncbi:hypothetical protein, partial [Microbispora triticiradicis]|uniref:hypothetical protein n=1 Tax=Microbispora triticiradicis TaxID=2200763 RepID=UPI001AD7508C
MHYTTITRSGLPLSLTALLAVFAGDLVNADAAHAIPASPSPSPVLTINSRPAPLPTLSPID